VIKTHGYPTIQDYYKDASSASYVNGIAIPTLFINAEDDPIALIEAAPLHNLKNPNIIYVTTTTGGHLGTYRIS
jgi:predicted alpha/beta-fold hydrolase